MKYRPGFSLVEVCVVVMIGAIITAALVNLLSTSRSETKRGSDMIQTQLLLERIVASLRSDIRSLRHLQNISDKGLQIEILSEDGNSTQSIIYDMIDGVLTRSADGRSRALSSSGEIAAIYFKPRPDQQNFQYLEMALMVEVDEPGPDNNLKASRMTIISHFFPYCKDDLPIYAKN